MILETSFLVDVLRGTPAAKATILALDKESEAIFLPAPSVFELWEGAGLALRSEAERRKVEALAQSYDVLAFDRTDARSAGLLQARLAKAGRRMGTVDVAVAGMALARNQVLVTGDRDFSAVQGIVHIRSSR